MEITESGLMESNVGAEQFLHMLHALGVSLSIDDFGTGYSSLSYLQRLRPNDLKVDKSFVTEMMSDENDAVIVRSIVELAHWLGMTVVAEGVEDAPTLSRLAEMRCDRAQGYHIARPMREDQLRVWLAQRRASEVEVEAAVNQS